VQHADDGSALKKNLRKLTCQNWPCCLDSLKNRPHLT
jgi:hypothetical protein